MKKYSCPGWSFYKQAGDPQKDEGVQREIKRSDAPYWGAVEWLCMNLQDAELFRQALENTLADPRCRILCIYNWEGINDKKPVLDAIRQVVAAGVSAGNETPQPSGGLIRGSGPHAPSSTE